ncbi:hypothetical protein K8R32_00655 [bacterium]|nr:hypothetical protein [bacterium]
MMHNKKGFVEIIIIVVLCGIIALIIVAGIFTTSKGNEIVDKLMENGQRLSALSTEEQKFYNDHENSRKAINEILAEKGIKYLYDRKNQKIDITQKEVASKSKDEKKEISGDSDDILQLYYGQLVLLKNQRRIIRTEYPGSEKLVVELEKTIKATKLKIRSLEKKDKDGS